ncbi:MAG: SinI family restriction endonuclease [Verrucomicrobiota bacterium]
MKFIANAEKIARTAMKENGHPEPADKFATVIRFLAQHPEAASQPRKKVAIGSLMYIQAAAVSFANSRIPKSPEPPSTVPDEMVSYILKEYYSYLRALRGLCGAIHSIACPSPTPWYSLGWAADDRWRGNPLEESPNTPRQHAA